MITAAIVLVCSVSEPVTRVAALRRTERAAGPGFGLLTPLYVHGDEDGPLTRLLSTHPPLDERVERLKALADQRRRRIEIR